MTDQDTPMDDSYLGDGVTPGYEWATRYRVYPCVAWGDTKPLAEGDTWAEVLSQLEGVTP